MGVWTPGVATGPAAYLGSTRFASCHTSNDPHEGIG